MNHTAGNKTDFELPGDLGEHDPRRMEHPLGNEPGSGGHEVKPNSREVLGESADEPTAAKHDHDNQPGSDNTAAQAFEGGAAETMDRSKRQANAGHGGLRDGENTGDVTSRAGLQQESTRHHGHESIPQRVGEEAISHHGQSQRGHESIPQRVGEEAISHRGNQSIPQQGYESNTLGHHGHEHGGAGMNAMQPGGVGSSMQPSDSSTTGMGSGIGSTGTGFGSTGTHGHHGLEHGGAGIGSTGAGIGSTGMGSSGMGSTGMGSTGMGSTGMGSTGMGSTSMGSSMQSGSEPISGMRGSGVGGEPYDAGNQQVPGYGGAAPQHGHHQHTGQHTTRAGELLDPASGNEPGVPGYSRQ